MLYHVPDRRKALSEISRVLKVDGILYATTIDSASMRELFDLVFTYYSIPDVQRKTVAAEFGLENGREQLAGYFKDVELTRYKNSLVVREARPLVDYICSSTGVSRITQFFTDERRHEFEEYLEGIIKKEGPINITKDSGMFIAKK